MGYHQPHADAARAWQAGAGSEIDVDLGAKHSSRYHQPVRIRAHVERLSDGRFTETGHVAQHVDMGRCALLRVGSIHIVVSEHAGPGHDPGVYRQTARDRAPPPSIGWTTTRFPIPSTLWTRT